MDKTIEALKLALGQLQAGFPGNAMQILREALAQTELCKYGQEPKSCTSNPMDCQCAIDASLAQTQEPVAWLSTDSIGERHLCFDKPLDNDPVQPLYTHPPQRSESFGKLSAWVGLTDEDICMFSMLLDDKSDVAVFTAIEAKLKELNT